MPSKIPENHEQVHAGTSAMTAARKLAYLTADEGS